MKSVFAPHLKRDVKFGWKLRKAGVPLLHLRDFVTTLPAIPATCDYSHPAVIPLRDIDGNDAYGDCVYACLYHFLAVATGNATGTPFRATQAQVLADYARDTGFNPNDPSTDNGADIPTTLAAYMKHPFADGSKIVGYATVNGGDFQLLKTALYLFEMLDFGIGLPDHWITPFPSGDGFVWDKVAGGSDPQNGHSFYGYGYDGSDINIDSWGLFGKITQAACAAYATGSGGGEVYVALTPDLLAKGAVKAPNGFAWGDLVTQLNAWGGNAPPPPPTPSGPVTLAQAQEWAADGVGAGPFIGHRSFFEKRARIGLADKWPK